MSAEMYSTGVGTLGELHSSTGTLTLWSLDKSLEYRPSLELTGCNTGGRPTCRPTERRISAGENTYKYVSSPHSRRGDNSAYLL